MTFLTDFADQAVILPLVLAVALVLALQGWRRGALAWLAAIAVTFAVVLLLKLVFFGCASLFGPIELRSPSGHVAAASVVAGGIVAIVARRHRLIPPVVLLTATLFGLTRIGLQVHSWPEVILGGLVGLAGAMVLAHFAGPSPLRSARPLLLVCTLVVVLFHGRHLEAEVVIQRLAASSGLFPAFCQPDAHTRP